MNSDCGEAKCSNSLVLANLKYKQACVTRQECLQRGPIRPGSARELAHSVTPVGRSALGPHQAPSPLAATGPRSEGNSQEPRYQGEV